MTDTRVEDDFRIEGSGVDIEGTMNEIHARLRARREQAEAQGLDYDSYADGRYPLPPNAVLSRDVYDAVRHVQLASDKVNVEMLLTETRLPVIGGLVHRARKVLHELVLFYVRRLAARQTSFNQQTALALTAIVGEMEAEARRNRTHTAEGEGSQDQIELQP
jgi:hypothetical protein